MLNASMSSRRKEEQEKKTLERGNIRNASGSAFPRCEESKDRC